MYLNTSSPILFTDDEIYTSNSLGSIFPLEPKALLPILTRVEGSLMLSVPLKTVNASSPISVTPSGIVIYLRSAHAKADLPIYLSVDGSSSSVRFSYPQNANSSILSIPSGITILLAAHSAKP